MTWLNDCHTRLGNGKSVKEQHFSGKKNQIQWIVFSPFPVQFYSPTCRSPREIFVAFPKKEKSLPSTEPLALDTIYHKLKTGSIQLLEKSKMLISRLQHLCFLASLRVSCKCWLQHSQTRRFWQCLRQEHFRLSFPGDSPAQRTPSPLLPQS